MINKKNVFGVEPLSKKIIESTSEVVDEDELIVWNTKSINEISRRIRRGERLKEKVPFLEGMPDYRKYGTLFEYTQQELDEYMKCKNDVIYFAENYCYIVNDGKKFKINLWEYQRRILRDFQEYPMHVLLSSRQSGKTTTVAIFLAWFSMFNNNMTVLATAHISGGMLQTLRNVRLIYNNMPFYLKPGCYSTAVTSLNWDNDSRILGATTTENSGRSIPVNLLYCLDGKTSYITVKDKQTGVIKEISIEELYNDL